MGLSKSNRIIILLVIDTAFFLLELTVGYAVHSLALVADSFHMLNDVLSLCVGLWAVKVANEKTNSKMYTYGWQRAETLGALVNGVFLVALCMSIFLDAIQRFVEPQEVTNPKLVCIVGCFGLLSNIFGLVLFHDHSHGGHGHGHAHEEVADMGIAEQGYASPPVVGDDPRDAGPMSRSSGGFTRSDETESTTVDRHAESPARLSQSRSRRSRTYSGSTRPFDANSIHIHPASLRQDIIAASRFEDEESSESEAEPCLAEDGGLGPTERSSLLAPGAEAPKYTTGKPQGRQSKITATNVHGKHNHAQPKGHDAKKGHSHSDLNMRGVFLHVMGDALGNIGVIASALIIWLTSSPYRFYVDPGISLVITIIILLSALPLCKAASRILLQAVPHGLSIDQIKEDIELLPGVVSCHHLHVWQLSDTKLVASLHIQVEHGTKNEGSDRYMCLAKQIRQCLHAYGIHSSTIQPEFYPESEVDDECPSSVRKSDAGNGSSHLASRAGSFGENEPAACLLECGDECADGRQCCPGLKRQGE